MNPAFHNFNPSTSAEAVGNARLIAAAPEMLSALRMALYELTETADRPNAKEYTAGHIRAAIAKATGV